MLFSLGGDPVTVEWYRARPGQTWAPDGNLFVSGNWISRDLVAGELGEQPGPKPWASGKDFRLYPVQDGPPCSMDYGLEHGLEAGQTTGPWTTEGRLDCCDAECCELDPLPPPPRQCDEATFPTLTATVTATTGGFDPFMGDIYPMTQWDAGQPGAWLTGDGGSGAFVLFPGYADWALCVVCDDSCNMRAKLDSATLCAGDLGEFVSGNICDNPVSIVVNYDNGFGDTMEMLIEE